MGSVLSFIFGPIINLISKFFPAPEDGNTKATLAAEAQSQDLHTQLAGDIAQAASSAITTVSDNVTAGLIAAQPTTVNAFSWFIAGWRPFIGWVCGLGLAYNTVVLAVLKSLIAITVIFGVTPHFAHELESCLPQVDMVLLGNVMCQMLGISAMAGFRTIEKIHGVQRESMDDPS